MPDNARMIDPHPLDRLFAVIRSRVGADPASSYTARLLSQGKLKIAKKLGEEAVETALAAVAQGKTCVAAESADLLYHLLVLWAACDVSPEEVYRALEARAGRSGLEEKAARKQE
ncbi:MAG TPA: phosphoribosyl-ATP diphosphatase [Rhizomicrobium sp.]